MFSLRQFFFKKKPAPIQAKPQRNISFYPEKSGVEFKNTCRQCGAVAIFNQSSRVRFTSGNPYMDIHEYYAQYQCLQCFQTRFVPIKKVNENNVKPPAPCGCGGTVSRSERLVCPACKTMY